MRLRIIRTLIIAGAGWPAALVFGQAGAPAGAIPQAIQLPLSGRTGQGGVVATQLPIPGATTSVNTINPTVQINGPYTGASYSTVTRPFSGKLSLRDAIERGIQYNIGSLGNSYAVRQAAGQVRVVRSALMPNLNSTLSETVQQVNLAAQGFRISTPFPGIKIPAVVGPFNYFDLRARLSQTIADYTSLNNYRSSKQILYANQYLAQDSKELVVLAVGGAYLQAVAAKSRVDAARAQLETAHVLNEQTAQQRAAGLVAQIDVNRTEVQELTQRQRVVSLENDLAKLKITLARLIGIAPNDRFELADDVPFGPGPTLTEEEAIQRALSQRADLKASQAQIRAANYTHTAARSERLPSLALNADYGVIGMNPSQSHGTFSVTGTLRIPIWQGGRTEGDIEQASAELDFRRAELEELTSQVEAEVRNAFLDLEAAGSQVQVARQNLDVSRQTLALTRQRFEAGFATTADVSQAQSTIASADLDLINSIFAHNLAKLSLARSEGEAAENMENVLTPVPAGTAPVH